MSDRKAGEQNAPASQSDKLPKLPPKQSLLDSDSVDLTPSAEAQLLQSQGGNVNQLAASTGPTSISIDGYREVSLPQTPAIQTEPSPPATPSWQAYPPAPLEVSA